VRKSVSLFFVFIFFFCFSTKAQEELHELLSNPSMNLVYKTKQKSIRSGVSLDFFINPYLIIDTLELPFIDDFSSNRLISNYPGSYPSEAITDSMAYSFLVDDQVKSNITYMLSPSYSYSFNVMENRLDSFVKASFSVSLFENPSEPFKASSTLTVWPEYYRHRYDSSGNLIDSVYIAPDVIKTLITETIQVIKTEYLDARWSDYNVYVNNNYPINPPTIGVATFDGLKYDGTPYSPNQPLSKGVADHLTSKPINLLYDIQDSIYLSFYYQAQGLGNAPEPEDSLVLEFYSPLDKSWTWKWSVAGHSGSAFKQVLIPIKESKFLVKGFAFRFKNYATLSGNLDHWHIDYVKLNKTRNFQDFDPDDVGFVEKANVLLASYQEMPWRQFVANPSAEMFDSLKVTLRNSSLSNKVVTYTYSINDKSGNELATNNGLNGNESPQSLFVYKNKLNFSFPTSNEQFERFEVLNIANVPIIGDEVKFNDTVRHFQKFDHHFAYDDASAEAAYGLNSMGGKLAYRFFLNTSDTLSAVAIHFAQVNYDLSFYSFKLTIWSSLSPESIVYQSQDYVFPIYLKEINGFYVYEIDPLVLPAGNFYVGMVQSSADKLNIGFDKNTDASANMFYNVQGTWVNSQFYGSWLIRPVLGTPVLPVGIENIKLNKGSVENALSSIGLFPNPSEGIFNINLEIERELAISVFDLSGKVLEVFLAKGDRQLDLRNLSNGIYFVQFMDPTSQVFGRSKIIINK
jgi:hypothetical protein